MANDAPNSISFYLLLNKCNEEDLANLRSWKNLKVAFESDQIWITGFSAEQIESVEVKSIPFKSIFYKQKDKLYRQHSLLPDRALPDHLLWTPIERAFRIKPGSFNHNFFGVNESISVNLVHSDTIKEPQAMIVSINVLEQYIKSAPGVRLNNIKWLLLSGDKALLLGKPILPINGDVLWVDGSFLIPVGYQFELYLLNTLVNKTINPDSDAWIWWHLDNTYTKIPKNELQALTRSSFRKTMTKCNEELNHEYN